MALYMPHYETFAMFTAISFPASQSGEEKHVWPGYYQHD